MTKARLTDWYIPKNPIWEYFEQVLKKEQYVVESIENENNIEELIEQLQISTLALYSAKSDLLEYVQYYSHPIAIMDLLKRLFFDLNKQLLTFENRIVELGSSVDLEWRDYATKLKHRHESESLTEMYKVPILTNAGEIKKEFLDHIGQKEMLESTSFKDLFKDSLYEKAISCLVENKIIKDNGNETFDFIAPRYDIRSPKMGICMLYIALDFLNYLKPNNLNGVKITELLTSTFINHIVSKKTFSDANIKIGSNPKFNNNPYLKFYSTILPKIQN
ncbi:hypothetical protein MWU78_14390 [Arenibacter sp. F26102]|uniref:hypothetical protein n=1 Tax=Arenibacter sp. F26102 TaxID=2926416 RepID=UPI001FF50072|nr:hypothetical protein [Arenibacter sp. F26102]MCK0146843.1 hypothetical protein [Arenibacter sp. F26102]